MAYSRRKPVRASSRRVASRSAPRSYSRTSRAVRRAPARSRSRSAGSTIRIVLVNETASAIARPGLGVMNAPTPRRPAFG